MAKKQAKAATRARPAPKGQKKSDARQAATAGKAK